MWRIQDGYHFESGPSLYSGMAAHGRAANPLSHVMQAIGESLDLIEYNCWNLVLALSVTSSRCVLQPHLADHICACTSMTMFTDPACSVVSCDFVVQVLPEGQFITEIGNDQFEGVIRQISGDAAVAEWRHLQEVMRPLAKAATTLPPAAIRLDPGAERSTFTLCVTYYISFA